MKTLVYVEHDNAAMKDATLAVVTAASKLGEVHALVCGSDCAAVGEQVAKVAGIGKVHVADDPAFANQLPENVAPLVVDLMGHHDAFLAPATTTGKNIAPRVAALLDVMQISDILSVESEDTFTRPIYAGNAIAHRANVGREEGHHRARHGVRQGRSRRRQRGDRGDRRRGRFAPVGVRQRGSGGKRTPPNSPAPRSSYRAAARWARARSSRKSSRPWLTSWAPASARAARRSTRASSPTTTRSARRARSSLPKSILPSAYRVRSSTSPA